MRYSDDFRSSAVIMLEAQGYPEREGALTHVSRHLGVPMSTLHRWYNKKQNPPPSILVTEKKASLEEYLRAELVAIFEELTDARWDADYRTLATAAGIFLDKLQLLSGGATARLEVFSPMTTAALKKLDIEPDSAMAEFERLVQQKAQEIDKP